MGRGWRERVPASRRHAGAVRSLHAIGRCGRPDHRAHRTASHGLSGIRAERRLVGVNRNYKFGLGSARQIRDAPPGRFRIPLPRLQRRGQKLHAGICAASLFRRWLVVADIAPRNCRGIWGRGCGNITTWPGTPRSGSGRASSRCGSIARRKLPSITCGVAALIGTIAQMKRIEHPRKQYLTNKKEHHTGADVGNRQ